MPIDIRICPRDARCQTPFSSCRHPPLACCARKIYNIQQVLIDLHTDNSIYYCGNTLGRGGNGSTALERGGSSGRLKVWFCQHRWFMFLGTRGRFLLRCPGGNKLQSGGVIFLCADSTGRKHSCSTKRHVDTLPAFDVQETSGLSATGVWEWPLFAAGMVWTESSKSWCVCVLECFAFIFAFVMRGSCCD